MGQNGPILQAEMPDDLREAAQAPLPRMRPVAGKWVYRDDAFEAQRAEKARLIKAQRGLVIAALPGAEAACLAALDHVCDQIEQVATSAMRADPLAAIAGLIQEDICILQKRGGAHVLTAALLCFPAGWTLAEKLGRPLGRIHNPVASYDGHVATRVQRLFDGVQVGRPLWRANMLAYDDPTLFQPFAEADPRPTGSVGGLYLRSERQTVLRLLDDDAVVFAIHTTVVRST